MAKETERKFLVREEILIPLLRDGNFIMKHLSQYYLYSSKDVAVRLRLEEQRHLFQRPKLFITVKIGGDGMTTNEFEFRVGEDGAGEEYLNSFDSRQGSEIAKTRYLVPHGEHFFEIDVFGGELEGLVVAELEADDAALVTDLPDWIDEEVTFDPSYKNAVLALQGAPAALAVRLSAMPDTLEAIRRLNNPATRPTAMIRQRRSLAGIAAHSHPDDEKHRDALRLATASAIRAALAVLDFNPPATAEEERSRALDQLGALDGELLDVEASYSDIESDTGILDFFRDLLSDDEELDDPVSHRAREDELTDLTGSVPDNLASWQAANAHLQQDLDAIVIGEIGDEPSRQIAKLAAAIGRQSWPDPDPSLEERRERVLEALDELDPFDFEIPNFDTDSQKGN